ncbi:hypothetical protein EYF80_019789 [Liparis tanakae]|uniref:Uncharacterized protein n=1 Tax=Liparis tanakae TaxID=230148 RepID=A0A4Z2HVP3_9TELE|nr:hypothetical protein EYF80_019789 [Liparis tanakae]
MRVGNAPWRAGLAGLAPGAGTQGPAVNAGLGGKHHSVLWRIISARRRRRRLFTRTERRRKASGSSMKRIFSRERRSTWARSSRTGATCRTRLVRAVTPTEPHGGAAADRQVLVQRSDSHRGWSGKEKEQSGDQQDYWNKKAAQTE